MSCPKAISPPAASTIPHAAKKSHPALKMNTSAISITFAPELTANKKRGAKRRDSSSPRAAAALLLLCACRLAGHVLLHARFPIGLDLLHLGLLVGRE